MIVVDASLATKWFIAEADSAAATAFLRTHISEVCGPDLIFIEVASAIVRRGNAIKTVAADATRALDNWTIALARHVVRRHETTQRRLFASSRLALELGHPLKDCIYLQLAMEFGADLVTCDTRFIEKARSRWPRARLLVEAA